MQEDFPVFSLPIRDLPLEDEFGQDSPHPLESSCPQTPFTATQALGVETSRLDRRMDPEKLANSRGVGG